ncbi:MAG: hypothetical protein KatS3mg095_0575 [Candidatus Parcubacteria bacterium]|nr:MAG: hypothetical protein KatS3mg095_0575 [Candidatus Parcubacteria bacterium]
MNKKTQGFTLIEVLLVIGIIAILAGAIIVAVNPGRQLANTRNTQRTTDANSILNAITQNMTENQGKWSCTSSNYYSQSLPDATVTIVIDAETNSSQINLSCLSPLYLSRVPVDPSLPSDSTTTGYRLIYNSSTGRIKICGVDNADLGKTICVEK